MNSCIVRYSEIGLKGKNRIVFERKLVKNIRSCLNHNKIEYTTIKKPRGRIVISKIDNCKPLNRVFGISSFSKAVNTGFNMDEIKKIALTLVQDKLNGKSFCVACQRLDKSFPMKSPELAGELGEFIQKQTNAKVQLKKPDVTLYVEVIDGVVYLFTEKIRGPGGLPVGIEGNVLAIIESEASLLAALLMLKRGCSVFCIAKKEFGIDLLKKYTYGSRVELKILENDDEINNFADQNKIKAIIVSDTVDSIKEYNFTLPVYRPLSTLSKKQIEEKLNEFRKRVC